VTLAVGKRSLATPVCTDSVVKLPVLGVMFPMGMLLMAPDESRARPAPFQIQGLPPNG